MDTFAKVVGVMVLFVAAIVVVGLLMSLPVMWLWNWLMPGLLGLRTLGWLEAWGLLILCGLLFKNSTQTSSK